MRGFPYFCSLPPLEGSGHCHPQAPPMGSRGQREQVSENKSSQPAQTQLLRGDPQPDPSQYGGAAGKTSAPLQRLTLLGLVFAVFLSLLSPLLIVSFLTHNIENQRSHTRHWYCWE